MYVENTERPTTGDFFNMHIQYSWEKLVLALYYLEKTETIGLVSGKLYNDGQASLLHQEVLLQKGQSLINLEFIFLSKNTIWQHLKYR